MVRLVLLVGIAAAITTSSASVEKGATKFSPISKFETAKHDFDLFGNLFKETGSYRHTLHGITSSVLHWFSPFVETEAKRKFLGPPFENEYYASVPAVTWFDGDFVLVSKVWLDRRRFWKDTNEIHLLNKRPPQRNNFNDNWLYHQRFDSTLNPVSYGSFLGIPAPSQYKFNDGPSDPRLFVLRGSLYLLFNMDMALNATTDINYPVIWDFKNTGPVWIEIEGGSPFWSQPEGSKHPDGIIRDRHWSPLVDSGELYMVYTMDPLRVMKCIMTEVKCFCKFILTNPPAPSSFIFNEMTEHLRGGTAFVLYKYPLYISIAHSVLYTQTNKNQLPARRLAVHLVVLAVKPAFRIVYVSSNIEVSPSVFEYAPEADQTDAGDDFLFPAGLIIEDADSLCLGLGVNNKNSFLVRLTGVDALMRDVFSADEEELSGKGAPLLSVQETLYNKMSSLSSVEYIRG